MSDQKQGHQVKALKNLVPPMEGTVLIKSSLNYVILFISIKSKQGLNLSHLWSKTRSLDQVKNRIHSIGHSFDSIFMKLFQNVYLHDI